MEPTDLARMRAAKGCGAEVDGPLALTHRVALDWAARGCDACATLVWEACQPAPAAQPDASRPAPVNPDAGWREVRPGYWRRLTPAAGLHVHQLDGGMDSGSGWEWACLADNTDWTEVSWAATRAEAQAAADAAAAQCEAPR